MEYFPFKKVTATSGAGAGQELARSGQRWRNPQKNKKNFFQHTLRHGVFTSVPSPKLKNNGNGVVVSGDEVDATYRRGKKGKVARGRKTSEMMRERLHPSLQSSAKVANVSLA